MMVATVAGGHFCLACGHAVHEHTAQQQPVLVQQQSSNNNSSNNNSNKQPPHLARSRPPLTLPRAFCR